MMSTAQIWPCGWASTVLHLGGRLLQLLRPGLQLHRPGGPLQPGLGRLPGGHGRRDGLGLPQVPPPAVTQAPRTQAGPKKDIIF